MSLSKSETKELRRLLKEACFARDNNTCQRCRKIDTLSPSHIYPKGRYRNIEFDVENVITLCYACHLQFWHKNPIEAWNWYENTIPKARRDKLKLRANTPRAMPRHYNTLKLYLDSEIKKYERLNK